MKPSFYTSFPADPEEIRKNYFLRYDTINGESHLFVKQKKDMTWREMIPFYILRWFGLGYCSIPKKLSDHPRSWKYLPLQDPTTSRISEVATGQLHNILPPLAKMKVDLSGENPLPENYYDMPQAWQKDYGYGRNRLEENRKRIIAIRKQMSSAMNEVLASIDKGLADVSFDKDGLSELSDRDKMIYITEVLREVFDKILDHCDDTQLILDSLAAPKNQDTEIKKLLYPKIKTHDFFLIRCGTELARCKRAATAYVDTMQERCRVRM